MRKIKKTGGLKMAKVTDLKGSKIPGKGIAENGTETDNYEGRFSFLVSAQADRYHILEKVCLADGDNVPTLIDRANFKHKDDALAAWKKTIQDAEKIKLKARIEAVEYEIDRTVTEIRSGQERLDFKK